MYAIRSYYVVSNTGCLTHRTPIPVGPNILWPENAKTQRLRVKNEIAEFFTERLRVFLKDKGYRTDIVNAVFNCDVNSYNFV